LQTVLKVTTKAEILAYMDNKAQLIAKEKADKEKAEQTALKLSGRLVICHRDGNKFTAQIQDCSGQE
jgi:hypothetical protein